MRHSRLFPEILLVLMFTALGFLAMGYHPGAEDDAVYLSAVKANLNPALYPHDAAFFQLQMQASIFDKLMARFVLLTGMPVAWAEFLWQFLILFAALWACWSIVSRLFEEPFARWAGVAMVAAMFTLPVAGAAITIMDQYLHPRNAAAALILLGISRIMAGRQWHALPLVALAVALHPLMGAFGISFCATLILVRHDFTYAWLRGLKSRMVPAAALPAAAFIPFGWVFGPPSPTWLEALNSRHWFRLYRWTWYEWIGAIAPLLLFWLVAHVARKRGDANRARFATAVLLYGVFQQALAMVMLGPTALISLSALEPMRYLHLVYVFMALIGGAYLGKYLLKQRPWRWALFLLIANGGMAIAQRQQFPASAHLELPWQSSGNPWQQAFAWIRQNTQEDAYFAIDPNYMAARGNDFHSFRALAERSQLADGIKDTSVITKVPELGPTWKRQLDAQQGWNSFGLGDFERLKVEFGVDWVLVSYPSAAMQASGLQCHWHNDALAVCQIP